MHRRFLFPSLLLVMLLGSMVPAALALPGPVVPERAAPARPADQIASLVYSQNFDTDNGGYTTGGTNSSWAWGAPSGTGNPGAHSSPNVWATNLSGYYNNSEDSWTASPNIDLSAYAGQSCTIRWWQWRATESCCDYVAVELSSDGGSTWTRVYGPVYGASTGWEQQSYNMPAGYSTSQFQVRFFFHSDSSVNSYLGFYVDDVTITSPEPNFSTSRKTAPGMVLTGDWITYTVYITNSGTLDVTGVRMTDTIPLNTTYNNNVWCSAGTCAYDAGNNRILWNGDLAIGAGARVIFSVDTDSVPCASNVVNTAQIGHTPSGVYASKSATTQVVNWTPVLTEGFENTTFPPTNWGQTQLIGTNVWDRVTSGSSPTISPHGGGAMARWNSYTGSGNSTRLYSPVLDLSSVAMPVLTFWMSHDIGGTTYPGTYQTYFDRIQVQLSTDGGTTWTNVGTAIPRTDHTCTTPCWKQHTIPLPAAGLQSSVRVGLTGVSAAGWYIYVDDVTVGEAQPCDYAALEPDQTSYTCRGNTAGYPLTVAQHAPAADTYNLTYSGAFPTTLTPAAVSLGAIGAGNTTAAVYVPWATLPLNSDAGTATATGQAYARTDTAQLKTYSALATGYTDFADVPSGRRTRDASVVYLNGKLYKIGGYGEPSSYAARAYVDIYDIATNSWTTGDNMPAARYWIDCVPISNKIYCAGGYDTAARNTLYIYDPTQPSGSQWTTGTPLPANRYAYAGLAYNNKYYVIGGFDGSAYQATVYVYDPVSPGWTTVTPMTVPRRYHSAGLINGKFYVAGGLTTGAAPTAVVEVYDPVANSWSTAAPLPGYLSDGQPLITWVRAADGVLGDRYLVMVGGFARDSIVSPYALVYDAVNDAWHSLPTMGHQLYSPEGDVDANGDFWLTGGYETSSLPSRYTMRMNLCPSCIPVSGADFTVTPPIPRPNIPATFNGTVASGSPPITYAWSWGDGTPNGSGQNPTHTYTAVGNYTVVMTATNCDGANISVATHVVQVMTGPQIQVTPTSLSSTQCPNSTANKPLRICNVGDANLDWSTSESLSWLTETPVSGTVTPGACATVTVGFDSTGQAPGTYNGTLVVNSNDTANPTVNVGVTMVVAGPPTNADFTWTPTRPWINTPVSFSGSATALLPVVYTWAFGDGGTGSGQNPSHTYTAYGDFTVVMTATECGQTAVATHPVTVVPCYTKVPQQQFEVAFPPAGWTVINNGGDCVWTRNDAFATPRPNYAGGVGFCADADSDKCGSGTTMDTELRTVVFDLSDVTTATLKYMTSYNDIGTGGDYADTDVSTDGGATWSNLLHWDDDHSPNGPGELVTLDLTPYAGNANVMVRFHYYIATYDWWWEVDQVETYGCYVPGAVPDIDVTPTSLSQSLNPNQTANQTLNIANLGIAWLNWTADVGCGSSVSWLAMTPLSGSVPGRSNRNTTVTFDSAGYLDPVVLSTNICLNSNDPDEPQVIVPATLVVTGTAQASVSPAAVSKEQCPDTVTTQALQICNSGNVRLHWTLAENPAVPWLSESAGSGIAPIGGCSVVTATLDSAGLPPGGYTTNLELQSNDPAHPLIVVPVALTVDPVTEAGFTSNTPVCLGVTARFTNTTVGAGLTYLWAFGDGSTSTAVNPTHLYDIAGDYTVVLTATGACGVDTAEETFTVNPLAEASFDYAPQAGYYPLTVYFTDTSAYADSPTWDFGDGGTGSGANVQHTYIAAGDYTVTLTVQSIYGCGAVTATALVHVVEPGLPIAGFTSSTPDCLGETTRFTNTTVVTGTTTYLWNFGDGGTSTEVNPTHTYGVVGTYTVYLTATNSQCSDTVHHPVVIAEAVGGADFVWSPDPPLVNATVYFTGSVAGGTEPIAYTWDFGDGGSAAGRYASHVYLAAGRYTATLTVENACGTDTIAHVIDVCEPVYDADFTWNPPMPAVNAVVYFTGTAAGSTPITYAWAFGDGGTGSGANVQHSYAAADTYTVVMTATGACGEPQVVTHDIVVTAECVPPSGFTYAWSPITPTVGEVVHYSATVAAGSEPMTYTWDFGDGQTAVGQYVTHAYTLYGHYVNTPAAYNGCGRVTGTFTINVVPACEAVQIVTATTTISGCVVDFAAQLHGDPPFTYLWAFGDGATSTLDRPTHTYGGPGNYNVTLEVWNCTAGHDVLTFPVRVHCGPAGYRIYLPIVLKQLP